jgi:hypothetical protein
MKRPMMRRSTGFDADEARRQPLKEWQNVPALELTANDYITCRDRLHVWLLRIVGALTAPTSMALPCRWRSRPQHHLRTHAPQQQRPYSITSSASASSLSGISQLQAAVRQSEHLRNVILQYKETLLGQVQQTAGWNALHKTEARLARWLLQTRDRVESDRIPLTQDFLSEMLGVRRTTVTEVAGVLQEAGLIRYRRGQVEILDRRGLEQAACECYGVIRRRTDQALPKADV